MANENYTTIDLIRDMLAVNPFADPLAKFLFERLCLHANHNESFGTFISKEVLAEETGMSLRTIRKHFDAFYQSGWVNPVDEGRRCSTHYIDVSRMQREAQAIREAKAQQKVSGWKSPFERPAPRGEASAPAPVHRKQESAVVTGEMIDPNMTVSVPDHWDRPRPAAPAAVAAQPATRSTTNSRLVGEISSIPALKNVLGEHGLKRLAEDAELATIGQDELIRRLGRMTGDQIKAVANAKKSPARYLRTCLLANGEKSSLKNVEEDTSHEQNTDLSEALARLNAALGDTGPALRASLADVPGERQCLAVLSLDDSDFESIEEADKPNAQAEFLLRNYLRYLPLNAHF